MHITLPPRAALWHTAFSVGGLWTSCGFKFVRLQEREREGGGTRPIHELRIWISEGLTQAYSEVWWAEFRGESFRNSQSTTLSLRDLSLWTDRIQGWLKLRLAAGRLAKVAPSERQRPASGKGKSALASLRQVGRNWPESTISSRQAVRRDLRG